MPYANIMLKNMTNKQLADKLELHQWWRRELMETRQHEMELLERIKDRL